VNGGVPAHHVLADPSLPALSNWCGLPMVAAAVFAGAIGRENKARFSVSKAGTAGTAASGSVNSSGYARLPMPVNQHSRMSPAGHAFYAA